MAAMNLRVLPEFKSSLLDRRFAIAQHFITEILQIVSSFDEQFCSDTNNGLPVIGTALELAVVTLKRFRMT